MNLYLMSLFVLVAATAFWPLCFYTKALISRFIKSSSEFKFYVFAQTLAVIVVILTIPKHW